MSLASILVGPVAELIGKFVVDKDEKNRLAYEIATLAEKQAHEVQLAQIEVNKVEAQHGSLFVAGWRPGVGWVCVFGLGVNYVLLPTVSILTAVYNNEPLQPMDLGELTPILLGMLGLGAYRTYEKTAGIARGSLNG